MAEQVERRRRRAGRRPARPPAGRRRGQRLLQPEREQDDAGDHREVQVGVGVAGHVVLIAAGLGCAEPPLGDYRDDVEVDPPQRRERGDAERGGGDDAERRALSSAATPIATIDSPRATIRIRPWRSAKCAAPVSTRRADHEVGAGDVERQRQRPDPSLQRARRRSEATAIRPTPIAVLIARPLTERAGWGRRGWRAGRARSGRRARCRRRPAKVERQAAEGLAARRARDQHAAIATKIDQPHRALLGIDDAGQPGVADPRPPEDAEHQQPLRQPLPGRVVDHQRRALGDREHEDEVEEKLQRRHPLAFAQRRLKTRAAVGFGRGLHRDA